MVSFHEVMYKYRLSKSDNLHVLSLADSIVFIVDIITVLFVDAPKNVKDNQAIIHDGQQSIYPKDLRGTKIYSIETGTKATHKELGEISKGYTTLKPASEFDSWDGKKWVLDVNKQHQYEVNQASVKKINLLLKQLRKSVICKMPLILRLPVIKKRNYSPNGKNIVRY